MKKDNNQKMGSVVQQQDDSDEKIIVLQNEITEWKSKYLRALADYQNLEKRNHDNRQEERKFIAEILLSKLLPVLDTLERVDMHVKDQGLALALKEFWNVLREQEVQKISVLGKPFDPLTMECIEVIEGEENIVIEEIRHGYFLHDKILRVAQVKVGKKMMNAE